MKFSVLIKPILFALSVVALAACGDKEKSTPAKSNEFQWAGQTEAVTYAAFTREDNSGGNISPNEYFELETRTYYLKLIIPQQLIDNDWHNWIQTRTFTVRFKSKLSGGFNFDMTQKSIDPNPKVVGGKFKVLSMSNDKYELEMTINIRHNENMSGAKIEVLKVYYKGPMIYDNSLTEWVDPSEPLNHLE